MNDDTDIIRAKYQEIRKVSKSNLISENGVISSLEDIDRLLNSLRNKLEAELKQNGEFKLI
ncbi:MAG: hypothetical protein ACLT9Z_07405 [Finegoldia magna]